MSILRRVIAVAAAAVLVLVTVGAGTAAAAPPGGGSTGGGGAGSAPQVDNTKWPAALNWVIPGTPEFTARYTAGVDPVVVGVVPDSFPVPAESWHR